MCKMHISGTVCIIISMSIIHLVNAETNKTVDDFQKYLDVRFKCISVLFGYYLLCCHFMLPMTYWNVHI